MVYGAYSAHGSVVGVGALVAAGTLVGAIVREDVGAAVGATTTCAVGRIAVTLSVSCAMAVGATACSFWPVLHAVTLMVKNKRMLHDSLARYGIWAFLLTPAG